MTSRPPVLHFFMHRAFICAAVNSDAFYIFVITCSTEAVLNTASSFSIIAKSAKCWARLFGKKHSPFFQKIQLRYEQTTYQSNRFQWENGEKTLTWYSDTSCKTNLVPVFYSAHSNRPTMGTNFPVKFPTLGRTSFIKCPTSAPPPTPRAKHW